MTFEDKGNFLLAYDERKLHPFNQNDVLYNVCLPTEFKFVKLKESCDPISELYGAESGF